MLAIETANLTKRYGGRSVVDDLTLHVPARCVFGFLGPNGAGKTTVMRLLLGLVRPDAGRVCLLGLDVAEKRAAALAQVGAFVEGPCLYDHLTGRANLQATSGLLGLSRGEVGRVLEVVDLTWAADQRAGTYSLGMRQRLALARALLGSPKLLLLDEPSNGLDPDGMIVMRDLIRDLPDRIGGTVFVSSHLLAEMEQTCSQIAVMRAGRIILQGDVGELLAEDRWLRIAVTEAARGAQSLRSAGFRTEAGGEGCLRVHVPPQVAFDQAAARANRLLVEAGMEVSGLALEHRSLESIYRSADHREGATA